MPGTSRHHWGTEIDIHSYNNESFEQGPGKAIYDWLTLHAADYGFSNPTQQDVIKDMRKKNGTGRTTQSAALCSSNTMHR